MLNTFENGKFGNALGRAAPPGPQPIVYPGVPHAVGDETFMLLPKLRIWELREPAYPAVSTIWPGNWCSTLTLNCCTRPSLISVFSVVKFPAKLTGVDGGDRRGNPSENPINCPVPTFGVPP